MRRVTTMAALLVAVSLCQPAHAADGPAGVEDKPPSASTEADNLTREGMAAGKRGEWKKAHVALTRAWSLKKAYDIAGNLARTERELGLWASAAEHLYFAKEHMPAFVESKARETIEKQYVLATKHVLTLTMTCNVEGATVTLTGQAAKTTPLTGPLFLMPGKVELQIARVGYQTATESIDVKAGATKTIAIELVPLEGDAAGSDGRLIGGAVLGVGALIGLGIGIGGSVSAAGHHSDIDAVLASNEVTFCHQSMSTTCVDLASMRADHDAAVDLATGGYVVGGVLAAASVGLLAWWALDEDDGDETTVMVAPTASADGAGLVLMGVW